MERLLTVEEKIKRAEDIYRRKNTGIRVSTNINTKKDIKLLKKMFIQVLICICIYSTYYVVKSNENIFSEETRNQINKILSHDINFKNIYEMGYKYFNGTKEEEKTEENVEQKNTIEAITEEPAKEELNKSENQLTDTLSVFEEILPEESSLSQNRIDADYIRNNFSIKIPLKGTITSRFGIRAPTTNGVPKYHTGIDIAANKGTKFVAAMEGTVTKVSSYGDFGKHFVITNGNVTTLYAHCSKIYVKEGEKIKQGKEIGEVGSTGNSTGPHLHFEIQVDGRIVNPDYITSF